jgi:hypothetical protein
MRRALEPHSEFFRACTSVAIGRITLLPPLAVGSHRLAHRANHLSGSVNSVFLEACVEVLQEYQQESMLPVCVLMLKYCWFYTEAHHVNYPLPAGGGGEHSRCHLYLTLLRMGRALQRENVIKHISEISLLESRQARDHGLALNAMHVATAHDVIYRYLTLSLFILY